jgi:hypothetical protein
VRSQGKGEEGQAERGATQVDEQVRTPHAGAFRGLIGFGAAEESRVPMNE